MADPLLMAAVAATFVLAGTVKGIIGLGLPTVSLALLALATDLHQAMALLLVPSFVTNLWQACVGGHGAALLRRLWPFLLMAAAAVAAGAAVWSRVPLALLSLLLGGLLVTYAALSLAGVRLAVAARHEPWAGPLAGAANGVLTGMTGSFVVPGVMYLQGLGLAKDALVQAMGMLFTVSTLALGVALHGHRLLTPEQGLVSVAAVIPALAGMVAGQRIRRCLSEARFRRVFFCSLLVLGAGIAARAASSAD